MTDDGLEGLSFDQFLDIDEIQKIQDAFAKASGVASIITTPEGEPITRPSNFCRLCNNIIRKTEKGRMNCVKSDAFIGKTEKNSFLVKKCLSGGLYDGGASIFIGDKHIANWLIGQVKSEDCDEDKMLRYALEIGADEKEYMKALKEVPVMSEEKFKDICEALSLMANHISQLAYDNYKKDMTIKELERTEKALEDGRHKIKSIFKSAPVGMGIVTNRVIGAANEKAEEITGYSKEDLKGQSVRILYPNDEEFEFVGREIYSQIENYSVGHIETKFKRKDGKIIDVQLSCSPVDFKDWSKGISFCVMDITDKKLSDKKIKDNWKLFESLMDNSPSVIYMKDLEGRYLLANRHFEKLVHISKEQILGKKDMDIFPKKFADKYKESDAEVTSEDTVLMTEEEALHDDGIHPYFSIKYPLKDFDGKIYGMGGISTDIHEYKKTEQALKESEENLRITLKSIGDAVISTDRETKIVRMNPVAETLTGWKEEEARGLALDEVFRIFNSETNKKVESPAEKVMREGKIIGLANHTSLMSKDGKKYQIADSGAPIRNSDNEIEGVVLVFRDVTEQYEMEEQLRQSQKMESIGQLAGGIAHDFNNMLGGIMGGAELLAMKTEDREDLQKHLKVIMEAAERASELTRKLLDFARKGNVATVPVDIHNAVDEACQLLERSIDRKIVIKTSFNAEKSIISGDPVQLQNMFINLVLNARDAMPGGGLIKISSCVIAIDEDFEDHQGGEIKSGNYVMVTVSDDGSGMPKDVQKRIFEPFFTTKDTGEGTGLGLSAVYGTVQNHSGVIMVDSHPNCGTEFKLYFPLTGEKVSKTEAQKKDINEGKGCVLVVDDEEIIRDMAEDMLKDMGYDVLLAENGKKALEIYWEKQKEIDVVLLDMVMPEMNGQDTFEVLKKTNSDVKVILSSGFSFDTSISRLISKGAVSFIQKPYRLSELAKIIKENICS